MNKLSLITMTKSGVVLRPQAVKLLHAYTRHFIQDGRAKLDEYLLDLQGSPEDPCAAAAQLEVCKAVELVRELDETDEHIGRAYDRNFQMWADVFRQARIQLRLTR